VNIEVARWRHQRLQPAKLLGPEVHHWRLRYVHNVLVHHQLLRWGDLLWFLSLVLLEMIKVDDANLLLVLEGADLHDLSEQLLLLRVLLLLVHTHNDGFVDVLVEAGVRRLPLSRCALLLLQKLQ
jgi:hypothetical protein